MSPNEVLFPPPLISRSACHGGVPELAIILFRIFRCHDHRRGGAVRSESYSVDSCDLRGECTGKRDETLVQTEHFKRETKKHAQGKNYFREDKGLEEEIES